MSQSKEDFDPSRFATARLFRHTTFKGIQLGGLVGSGFVLPILAIRGYRSGKPLDLKSTSQALTYSLAGGLILSTGLGLAKYVGMDQEGLEDRVYRLHYNASQNRCDTFSAVFGLLSAAAAPFLLNRSLFTIAGAFAVGATAGTLAHVATAKESPSGVEKMVHELKCWIGAAGPYTESREPRAVTPSFATLSAVAFYPEHCFRSSSLSSRLVMMPQSNSVAPLDFPPWFSVPSGERALLGQGGQASVFKVIDERINPYTGIRVGPIAVKCYPRSVLRNDSRKRRRVTREVLNHRKLCHKHIVGFREVRLTENYLFICFNYEDGGTLLECLQNGPLTETAARWVFQQLILAVDYSHRRSVAYRDIALDNILITGEHSGGWNITLCDLGLSRTKLSLERNGDVSHVGKPGYMAPEAMIHQNRSSFEMAVKNDLFACGVCLFKMLLGWNEWPLVPQKTGDPTSVVMHLAYLMDSPHEPDLQFDTYPYTLSEDCQYFLKRLLHMNPSFRIDMDEIWQDPWFTVDLPESRLYNDWTCSSQFIEECGSCLQSEVDLQYRVQQAATDFVPESYWH